MKSDVIQIYSDLRGKQEAADSAEGFIRYNGFSGKNAMHIRLLTEELVSMVHGIMEEFSGDLWFESEKTKKGVLCRICLSAKRLADPEQEKQLLSVATSGKNESARGILGKIREAFRVSAQYSGDAMVISEYASMNNWYGMGVGMSAASANTADMCWSLSNYRSNLPGDRNAAAEEWDELEKSIIGKLADDVKVWLRSATTDVVIEKFIEC